MALLPLLAATLGLAGCATSGGAAAPGTKTAVAYRSNGVKVVEPTIQVTRSPVHVELSQEGKGKVYSLTLSGPAGEYVVSYMNGDVESPVQDVTVAPGTYRTTIDGFVPDVESAGPYKNVFGTITAKITYR